MSRLWWTRTNLPTRWLTVRCNGADRQWGESRESRVEQLAENDELQNKWRRKVFPMLWGLRRRNRRWQCSAWEQVKGALLELPEDKGEVQIKKAWHLEAPGHAVANVIP